MNINLITEIPSKEEGVNLVIRTTENNNTVVISIENVKLAIEISNLEKALNKIKEVQKHL
jgi:hypothetical protein